MEHQIDSFLTGNILGYKYNKFVSKASRLLEIRFQIEIKYKMKRHSNIFKDFLDITKIN